MAPNELEDQLLAALDQSVIDPGFHRESLAQTEVPPLSELAGIGIDTNILKQFRREPIKADSFSATLQEHMVPLVVPGQCITEYWNNQNVFAREDIGKVLDQFERLQKSVVRLGAGGEMNQELESIGERIKTMRLDLEDASAPDFVRKSSAVLTQLLSDATTPKVSRSRFSALAEVRIRSKVPPGFSDEKLKAAPLGDVFVWFDFLLGIMALREQYDGSDPHFVWATEDSKADWKASGAAHPGLVEEALRTTGARVSIVNMAGLDGLVAAAAPAEREGDAND